MVENPPINAGDAGDQGSVPRSGRSPGVGNGNSLQYSFLENSMDRGVWWVTDHRIAKSQIQLSTHMHNDNNSHYWKELSHRISWADLGTGTESGKMK